MKNVKKAISLLLVLAIGCSFCVTAFADEVKSSVGSEANDITNTTKVGQDYAQLKESEYVNVEKENMADEHKVEVYVTKGSTYTITIPKTVILDGHSDTATGKYAVSVRGDVSGTETINVVPDESFKLSQTGKEDLTATIEQRKTAWIYGDLGDAEGTITATGLTAGSWSGNFKFNISKHEAATLSGDGQTYHRMAPSTLSFRSTAPMSEFQEVRVNGEVVDPSNYTLTEGSTIVTLSIDYLETLDIDKYEITVVSKNDAPSAGFEVITATKNELGFYYNQPYTYYDNDLFALFIRENGYIDFTLIRDTETVTSSINYTVKNDMLMLVFDGAEVPLNISADGTEISVEGGFTAKLYDNTEVVSDEQYIYIYSEPLGGYQVSAIDKTKSFYEPIRSNIYNKPVVCLAESAFTEVGWNNITSNPYLVAAPQIPNTVTTIASSAFYGCTSLKSINIPNSVITIEISAFVDCNSLTEITIPNSVTTIASRAFYGCTSLKSITIGAGLTNINSRAFGDCTNLTEIIFNGSIEQWNNIEKANTWNSKVPATQVICSDGVVSLV